MSLVDTETGEIVASVALAIPRPHEVTSPAELCESIEMALPLIDDPAELLDGRAKLLAIEQYIARTTKVGKARMEATARRIEVRAGQVIGEAEHGGSRGNQHTGGKSHACDLPIKKDDTYRLRLLAAHPDVVERVIADADDTKPPSQRKVLDAIRDHLATQHHDVKEGEDVTDRVAHIENLVKLGLGPHQIAEDLECGVATVRRLAKQHGITLPGSTEAKAAQWDEARDLAAQGYSSRQIAERLSIGANYVRSKAREFGIEIPADDLVGKTRHLDYARAVEQTVIDLEGAAMSIEVLGELNLTRTDVAQIADWVTSLEQSLSKLRSFKNQLKEMTQ